MIKRIDPEDVADDLITALGDVGLRADRFTTGPGVVGLNLWRQSGRYPLTALTISDNNQFQDIAWGQRYEHTLPLSTPLDEVVTAVVATVTNMQGDDDA